MRIFPLLLVLFSPFLQAHHLEPEHETTFRFCYQDQALPPFFLTSGYQVPKTQPGVIIELLQMLEKQQPGLKIRFARAPWSRCIKGLKRGDYDGVISSFSPKRMEYGVFPMQGEKADPKLTIGRASYCLYKSQKQGIKWNGTTFVNSSVLPIAVPKSYSIIQLLRQHQQSYQEVASSQQAFKLLLHGRVSSVATLCETGDRQLKQKEYQQFTRNTPPLEQHLGYLLLNRTFRAKHPNLSQQIWHNLTALQQQNMRTLLKAYSQGQ